MTDLEKLQAYSKEINRKLKRSGRSSRPFENVEIKLHGNTQIREHWYNQPGNPQVTKTWQFSFSMIDQFTEELREANDKEDEVSKG